MDGFKRKKTIKIWMINGVALFQETSMYPYVVCSKISWHDRKEIIEIAFPLKVGRQVCTIEKSVCMTSDHPHCKHAEMKLEKWGP
jgi:hypothetical protein